jgi:hypothetical protein
MAAHRPRRRRSGKYYRDRSLELNIRAKQRRQVKAQRLVELVRLEREEPHLTAVELARRLGVHAWTVFAYRKEIELRGGGEALVAAVLPATEEAPTAVELVTHLRSRLHAGTSWGELEAWFEAQLSVLTRAQMRAVVTLVRDADIELDQERLQERAELGMGAVARSARNQTQAQLVELLEGEMAG